MTDYERWVQQQLYDVASEEKQEKIYRQCAIDEAIAHINNGNVSDTLIKNAYRKAHADLERNFYN